MVQELEKPKQKLPETVLLSSQNDNNEAQKLFITSRKTRVLREILWDSGVDKGLVLQIELNALQRVCPEDKDLIQEFKVGAGFAYSEEDQYVNPTTIGKELSKITAQEFNAIQINQLLQKLELQYKDGQNWHLTEYGKQFGKLFPYENQGHSGFQLRWSTKVIQLLESHIQ